MRSKGWTTCKRYTLPPHSTNPTDANGGVRFIFTLIRLTATAGSNYEITGNRWRWPRTRFGLAPGAVPSHSNRRSEDHTSELQTLMRKSFDIICLKKQNKYISKQQKNSNR